MYFITVWGRERVFILALFSVVVLFMEDNGKVSGKSAMRKRKPEAQYFCILTSAGISFVQFLADFCFSNKKTKE